MRSMPRLTNINSLVIHHRLRRIWLKDNWYYGSLEGHEQWDLHKFFQPAKDLSDDQLIEHRKQITAERPSLPQRAGRTLAKFDDCLPSEALARVRKAKQRVVAGSERTARNANRKITIRAVVKPEPDLARIVVAMVDHLMRQQRAERDGLDT